MERAPFDGSGWLVPIARRSSPQRHLVCFPYAGGGPSAFRRWGHLMPDTISLMAVQLPGRERRYREPLTGDIRGIAAEITAALAPLGPERMTFFGHSMGSILAYETALKLQADHGASPAALIVSARRAPDLPQRRPPVHDLPDAEFLTEIERLGGTPSEVFAEPELLQLVLPILRGDMRLIETYLPASKPGSPLSCPILAMGGIDDADVTRDELAAWQQMTSAAFELRMYPGDHFFLNEHARDVVATIRAMGERSLQPAREGNTHPTSSA